MHNLKSARFWIRSLVLIAIAGELFASVCAQASPQLIVIGRAAFEVNRVGVCTAALWRIGSWIDQVQELMPEFHFPDRVVISIPEFYPSSSAASGDFIQYGEPLPEAQGASEQVGIDPTFAHELGHVIFEQPINLRQILPPDLALFEKRTQLKQLGQRINELNDQLTAEANGDWRATGDSDCVSNDRSAEGQKLCLKRKEVMAQSSAMSAQVSKTGVDELARPYNEFFADVVAVLITRDGQAMSRKLKDSARDFTASGAADLEGHDPHQYFFLTRRRIWDHYKALGMSRDSARLILAAAYAAIGSELAQRSKGGDLRDLSKEQLDQGLLEKVKQRLSSVGR